MDHGPETLAWLPLFKRREIRSATNGYEVDVASAKYHRPYLVTAAGFALLGTPLGAAMVCSLCGWLPSLGWTAQLEAHGQMQVYGFVVLFTMGIAHQMLHQVFGQTHGQGWMRFSLVAMAVGTSISVLRRRW